MRKIFEAAKHLLNNFYEYKTKDDENIMLNYVLKLSSSWMQWNSDFLGIVFFCSESFLS